MERKKAGTYGNTRVGGGKSFSWKAESKTFRLGLFWIMNIYSVIRRGISLRKLAAILTTLRVISELQDEAWSRMADCGGRTRGRPVRGLIPLCSAVRVCNVRMDEP